MLFSAILLGFLINIVPILIWLNFYLKQDKERDPTVWIIIALLLGIGVTPIVFGLEIWLMSALKNLFLGVNKDFLLSVITAPFIEEIAKFLPIYFFVFRKRAFNHTADAMLFLIISALGFAFIENTLVVAKDYLDTQFWVSGIQITLLRFISSTFLHTLSSGLLGYFWAMAIINKKRGGVLIISGIISATLLHALFNFFNLLIMNTGVTSGIVYLALLIIILFTFALVILRDFEILNRIRVKMNNIQ